MRHLRGVGYAAEEPQQGDVVDVRRGAGVKAKLVGDGHRETARTQRVLHRLAGAEIGGQRDRGDQFRQPEAVARCRLHGR
jgi:hypothetical protein